MAGFHRTAPVLGRSNVPLAADCGTDSTKVWVERATGPLRRERPPLFVRWAGTIWFNRNTEAESAKHAKYTKGE